MSKNVFGLFCHSNCQQEVQREAFWMDPNCIHSCIATLVTYPISPPFSPSTGSITTSVSGQRAMLSSSDLFQRIVRANSCKGLEEPAQFLKYFFEILILTMISKDPQ
jgi:hypothetical protein